MRKHAARLLFGVVEFSLHLLLLVAIVFISTLAAIGFQAVFGERSGQTISKPAAAPMEPFQLYPSMGQDQ